MGRDLIAWCFITALFVCSMGTPVCATEAPRPNIVHIFADDLGYGSVGFNGQTQILTPNLDALATGGMNFTNAYAAAICGPARAMLYAGFHNGHTLVDRNQNLNGFGGAFRDDGQTVGDYLQAAGYNTALFGKGGFGGTNGSGNLKPNPWIDDPFSLPNRQGFETFYGYIDHGRAHSYKIDSLWTTEEPADDDFDGVDEVGEKYYDFSLEGLWLEKTGNHSGNNAVNYSADLIADRTVEYIRSRAGGDQPFYVEHASTIPHFDIHAILDEPDWFVPYLDHPNTDNWGYNEWAYAAMITRMDRHIGQIVASLRDPNDDGDESDSIMDNTLIIFTSDNGPTTADNAPMWFFDANGEKRGGKRDLWDGGINVPMIAYWEGVIEPGTTTDVYTDLPDFMPTALELAGTRGPVGMDGVSIAPLLSGQGIQRHKNWIIQEHHEWNGPDGDSLNPRWAIIKDDYKLIKYSNGTLRLYDLIADPDENNELNIASNQSMVDELTKIALAEGVEREDSYTVEFQTWDGSHGALLQDPTHWSGTAGATDPVENWSALINNTTGEDRSVETLYVNVNLLGVEVRGDNGKQTLRVNRGRGVTGRNEVRISEGGRINMDAGHLISVRWVDILDGGELTGQGNVLADVYNDGTIAPGLPDDLGQPRREPQPLVIAPGATPPSDTDQLIAPVVTLEQEADQYLATTNPSFAVLDSTGRLNIDGNLFNTADSRIVIDLGGTDISDAVNPEHDHVVVTGAASLAGGLEIALIEGYTPTLGSSFEVLVANTIHGEFDPTEVDVPALADAGNHAVTLALLYEDYGIDDNPDRDIVRLLVTYRGDFNGDQMVNGSGDLTILTLNWLSHNASWQDGDANGDGLVNPTDLAALTLNWLAGTPTGGADGIPEPTSLVLLGLGGLVIARRRRSV